MMSFVRTSVPPSPPPLDPSANDARHQLANELAKGQYAGARPSWLDLIVAQVQKWLGSLFDRIGGGVPGGSALLTIVIVVLILAAIGIGFLVFGLPRLNRRSTAGGALFGADDDRNADSLRRAAERAADDGDFALAIEEMFRAIARGLAERVVITTFPGTTAHTFASRASDVFPQFRAELTRSADTFDRVRYLGAIGTDADWQAVRTLEAGLRQSRPVLEPVPV